MNKNSSIFKIDKELSIQSVNKLIKVEDALAEVIMQAKVEGLREATTNDYSKFFGQYIKYTGFQYTSEFTANSVYRWINSMNVSQVTKRTRLKALRAVFSRMLRAKLIQEDFFSHIVIKVDEQVKEGITEDNLMLLLSHFDLTNYFELRYAVGILLIWQTGIRISTLSKLTVHHIDFDDKLLKCSGDIMKNGRSLTLPLSDQILELLEVLVAQNEAIAEAREFESDLIFRSVNGKSYMISVGNNAFGKRLTEYGKKYDIPNVTAHSIRRGMAKQLLKDNLNVALIAKVLGHKSLSTTSKYLNISEEELINELRRLR